MRIASLVICAAGLMLGAGVAQAACENWGLASGRLSFAQSNSIGLGLRLVQKGQDISGDAWQIHMAPKDSLLQKLNMVGRDPAFEKGSVDGVRSGNNLDLKVYWGDAIGIYKISVDAHGQLSGSTYDIYHPSTKVQLVGYERAQCADAPPAAQTPTASKPVHRLGKRPAGTTEQACAAGFVWREASPTDKICVDSASRDRVARENATAATRWRDGAYGKNTCVSGMVWREAFSADQVCVAPMTRNAVREENRLAAQRTAH